MKSVTGPGTRATGRRARGVAAGLAVAGSVVCLAGAAWAGTVSTARGSPYDLAVKACARQGRTVRLVAKQTDDRYTQVGVAVSFECVGRPARRPAAARQSRKRAAR